MSTPYTDTANKPATTGSSPLLAVLRSPSYLLLWTATFASLLAGFFNYVAVAWLVLQLTGSTLAVGLVLAAASVPMALFMLLGGAVSDRFSARNTMVIAGVLRGLVVGLLAMLTLVHAIQLWELFLGAIVVGATSAFFVPASLSMLPQVVSKDGLEAANAYMNLSRTVAMVLGSAAAGVVVAAAGAGSALAVDALASLLAGLVVMLLPRSGKVAAKGNPLADVRDGIAYAWRDVQLRTMLVAVAVLNLFILGAIEVGLPALAHQRFSNGAAVLGSAFGAWGLGSTLGSLGAGARPLRGHLGRVLLAVLVLAGAGVAATGLATSFLPLLAVMLLMGLVEGSGTTYMMSWMQRRTDPGMLGRVMSIAILASTGLEPVALVLAGGLAARNLSLLFWVCAAAIELTAVGAALSRSVREL